MSNQALTSTRRVFLRDGSLLLLGAGATLASAKQLIADESKPGARLGLVTDLHYADKPPAGTRYYRETLAKFQEAAGEFTKAKIDAVVSLGDLIDSADTLEAETEYLARIQKEFAALPCDRHYVLGNHCVTTLTKKEFLQEVGQKQPHYSFDLGGYHFLVLDACFRSDGQPYGRNNFVWTDCNLPPDQIEWLREDLKETSKPTILFVHQRLDVENHYGVQQAKQIRELLEQSQQVLAVFQGHSHKNDLKTINGIHYCTLVAMIEGSGKENSGYSLLDLHEPGVLRLSGFRKQASYAWAT